MKESDEHRNIKISFKAYNYDSRIANTFIVYRHAERGIDRDNFIQLVQKAIDDYSESIRLDLHTLFNKAV